MGGEIVKNQHYVPQGYLRNFIIQGIKGEYVNVFDKIKQEYREKQAISNISSGRYFYDFEENFANDINSDKQFLEKWFANDIEPEYAKLLNCFINDYKGRNVIIKPYSKTIEFRKKFSNQIAFQFLRTKDKRDKVISVYNDMLKKGYKVFPNEPENLRIQDEDIINKAHYGLIHFTGVMNWYTLDEIIKRIFECNWLIVVNKTKIPFITSDNPVVVKNKEINKNLKRYKCEIENTDIITVLQKDILKASNYFGITSENVEILFPVNSELLLIMCKGDDYKYYDKYDNTYLYLDNEYTVNICNSLQYAFSTRNIYTNDDKSTFDDMLYWMKKEGLLKKKGVK